MEYNMTRKVKLAATRCMLPCASSGADQLCACAGRTPAAAPRVLTGVRARRALAAVGARRGVPGPARPPGGARDRRRGGLAAAHV